jgi:hypothetical protein
MSAGAEAVAVARRVTRFSGRGLLAGQGVICLDLKPTNIVMADWGPVITDVGAARDRITASRGSLPWAG